MKIKAQGSKDFGESWRNWVLLDADSVKGIPDDEILETLNMFRRSNGAGQYFSHSPIVRRQNTRVLVTQFAGYDI